MTGPASSIKLAVVDDHMVVQDGIRAMAERTPDIVFSGAASDGAELAALLAADEPDVLLLDLRLGSEHGFELCRTILGQRPRMRVLIFTAFGNLELLQASVRAGASGYVLKDVSTDGLPEIIRQVHTHGSYFDPRLASQVVLDAFGAEGASASERILTEREIAILRLIAAGQGNREIALALHLSAHTIKFHISKLMREFDVSRRSELVKVAFERQLL